MCLFCQKTIAVRKGVNLQRHHEQLHQQIIVYYLTASSCVWRFPSKFACFVYCGKARTITHNHDTWITADEA